ncbi:MAG: hypothetical protein U9N82_08885 [Thermodesulfobacteriota bacterium]|nr:hypothetical protein [Thermodesulfobacteriota bacterium]
MFSRVWLINLVLGVLTVFCGIKAFEVWTKWDQTPQEIKTTARKQKSKPGRRLSKTKRNIPPESTYKLVVDQDLFRTERAEFIPEEPKPKAKVKPADKRAAKKTEAFLKKTTLHGVVIVDQFRAALISNPELKTGQGSSKWVRVGDEIGELKLKEIKEEKIILSQGGRDYEILLYDKDKPKKRAVASKRKSGPTVVGATSKAKRKPAAVSPRSSRKNVPSVKKAKKQTPSEAKYKIIDTPFGKRRVKVN